jgi:hypothetical protein
MHTTVLSLCPCALTCASTIANSLSRFSISWTRQIGRARCWCQLLAEPAFLSVERGLFPHRGVVAAGALPRRGRHQLARATRRVVARVILGFRPHAPVRRRVAHVRGDLLQPPPRPRFIRPPRPAPPNDLLLTVGEALTRNGSCGPGNDTCRNHGLSVGARLRSLIALTAVKSSSYSSGVKVELMHSALVALPMHARCASPVRHTNRQTPQPTLLPPSCPTLSSSSGSVHAQPVMSSPELSATV